MLYLDDIQPVTLSHAKICANAPKCTPSAVRDPPRSASAHIQGKWVSQVPDIALQLQSLSHWMIAILRLRRFSHMASHPVTSNTRTHAALDRSTR